MMLIPVRFRFYAELNDLLPRHLQGLEIQNLLEPTATVKQGVETLGVPHAKVHLILVNGRAVAFDQPLGAGDRVSVYPEFKSFDIQILSPHTTRKANEG